MHGFTPISIAGALTSLIVSPLLILLIVRARREGAFQARPYVGLMVFESGFLVAYMTYLSFKPAEPGTTVSALDAFLGAAHGLLALAAFIGFWAMLPWAASAYRRGRNAFANRPWMAWAAIGVRAGAVATGEAIFLYHWIR